MNRRSMTKPLTKHSLHRVNMCPQELRNRVWAMFALGSLVALVHWTPAGAATALPPPYEGLVQAKSRKLDTVYLLPGADFAVYKKIMIDPVQVSFHKDWMREANRSRGAARISASDAQEIAQAARSGFQEIFAGAFKAKGYEVVSEPAADVLRLSPSVANLFINAPRPTSGAATRTYMVDAGEATLVLEVRDSTTGAILGLALDREATRGTGVTLATPASNRAEFEDLFRRWAAICVQGFERLKATRSVQSPPR
jgi:uncharacterized protein DUF3313